jgi:ring-1,2-phenylacetyl-CoA epoxidase subunit PaaD
VVKPVEGLWEVGSVQPELPREAPRELPVQAGLVERAWAVLETVLDPEVPALSVCDLGLVRDVQVGALQGPTGLTVVLTPTYSGCPATEVIGQAVHQALTDAGLGPVTVCWRRSPAWTTDWISEVGREKLRRYGIAPPGPTSASRPIHIAVRDIACPRCATLHTERLTPFGSTACKALYRCLDCREPFEHFKPI